jgi:hypothetical protein
VACVQAKTNPGASIRALRGLCATRSEGSSSTQARASAPTLAPTTAASSAPTTAATTAPPVASQSDIRASCEAAYDAGRGNAAEQPRDSWIADCVQGSGGAAAPTIGDAAKEAYEGFEPRPAQPPMRSSTSTGACQPLQMPMRTAPASCWHGKVPSADGRLRLASIGQVEGRPVTHAYETFRDDLRACANATSGDAALNEWNAAGAVPNMITAVQDLRADLGLPAA